MNFFLHNASFISTIYKIWKRTFSDDIHYLKVFSLEARLFLTSFQVQGSYVRSSGSMKSPWGWRLSPDDSSGELKGYLTFVTSTGLGKYPFCVKCLFFGFKAQKTVLTNLMSKAVRTPLKAQGLSRHEKHKGRQWVRTGKLQGVRLAQHWKSCSIKEQENTLNRLLKMKKKRNCIFNVFI